MTIDISDDSKLEALLTEVGEFGPFQVITLLLVSVPNIISATYVFNYMFAANTFDYRCKVPECDVVADNQPSAFDQHWLQFAIPSANGKIENCARYVPLHKNSLNGSYLCSADSFNTSEKIACSEYIYASDERNVQTEFNIHCSDSYKLALVGTVNNIGRFIFLPLTGLLSDKFGRLTVVVIGMMASSIFGLIKSFAMNYPFYITFEFLESAAGTCTFASTYVLAIEWISPRYRVLGCTIISVSYALGEMLLGFVAMYIHDFRTLIRILYTPGLFVIFYFWLVPESVRWLLITGRVNRAIKILKRTASVNGKKMSETSIEAIKSSLEIPSILITLPLLNRISRKILMFAALALTAIATIVTPWIPQENSMIVLVLFMLAKAAMAGAFAVLYIFTAEQWPTNLRTTIMNSYSMIGRILKAPLTVILVDQYESLPAFLFGCAAILGAILVLFCPETFQKKLPDTIEEAKYL